jgi:HAE1 family hydrophobic/amphiphilic exporter-1
MTPQMNRSGIEEALPRFSLERRIAVLVLFASVVVIGIVATLGIPLELIPSGFAPPFLAVNIPWSDAPAQEVLDKIILPLEEELSTIRGLDSLNSFAATGFGRCFMSFKSGTDMDVAYREVRDRIERARPRLPEDADRIFIRKHDDSAIPVYVAGLAIGDDVADSYNLIQNEIVTRLERLDGVAKVDVNGIQEKEIFIELDRGRTEAAGLDLYRLAQELEKDNFTMASGDVQHAERKLLLRSVARYGTLDAVRDLPVGPRTRLRDVGTVTYREPDRDWRVRANSRPAVALVILKEGQANTLQVARTIRQEMDRMREVPRLQGIQMVALFDQGRVILESLNTLLQSGRVGALFAAVVLFFFLRRLRMTAIITLSIPVSLLIALTVMFFAGETLNILSLLGLMISVGLLVDNSVVVAENIHRLHREGRSRREAAVQGTGEIALAITTATLTTVIVFLPVALVEGEAQFFLMRLALPISVALLASLVVAGVFVPLSVYLTLRNGRAETTRSHARYKGLIARLERLYDATLGRVNNAYASLLAVFLRRRLELVLVLTAVFALTAIAAKDHIEIVDVQEEERSGFEVQIRMPQNTTLEEAEAFFLECERIVEASQEELGLSGWFVVHRATQGSVEGWFNNPRTTDLSPREVTERVLEKLPEKPGVRFYTGEESEQDEKGQQVQVLALYAEDSTLLDQTAEALEPLFVQLDGVLGVKAATESSPSELGLVVDRERAQQQGVNPQVLAGVVSYALRGQTLSRYHSDGQDIPVRISFREKDRETLTQLSGFYVPTGQAGFVPLSSVTDVTFLPGSKQIFRRDKRITRSITLELEKGEEEAARTRIATLQDQLDLPEGVRFGEPAGAQDSDEDLASLLFAAKLSVVFIYLLMGILFESFILPLSIICTIPLAGIGVIWIHIATGYNIDFLGMVGVVLLIGVVVNNGIVLIDYVNRLRGRGMERAEALIQAAHRRFRPIMMTALTTICGMIPVTLSGASSIGLSYTSFGLTLIGGLMTATLLTLLAVPVLYTFFDDAHVIAGRTLRHALLERSTSGEAQP